MQIKQMKQIIDISSRINKAVEISQASGVNPNLISDWKSLLEKVENALKKSSLIVTIRNDKNEVVACGRALSDDMFFTTIPDIFVNPKYQKKCLGKIIMNKIIERYNHTKIFFGSQPGNEQFFEKLGFRKDLQSYAMKK